jgi:hypothetical protein
MPTPGALETFVPTMTDRMVARLAAARISSTRPSSTFTIGHGLVLAQPLADAGALH